MEEATRPPEMTSADFDALMERLYPSVRPVMMAHVSRPMAALSVAQHLWINAVPESEDTASFRAHMQHLERVGWFDFTDFRTS